MTRTKPTTQFKRDLKKASKDPRKDIDQLKSIIKMLDNREAIPPRFRPHPLHSNYNGHMECHVQPDFLLIWKHYEDEDLIQLVRCGSHSELFT